MTVYLGYDSALGVAKEITAGAFVTSTAFIEFNSESLAYMREEKKIESLNGTRDFIKRFQGIESVDGSIDFDLTVASDAAMNILKQCFGGTVSSVANTAGTAYLHTMNLGDMENNASTGAAEMRAISISVRRGATHRWNMQGCRVNNITISGEIGETVKVSAEILGMTASVTSTGPAIVISDVMPVVFTGVTIKKGTTIGAATTTCYTSFELSINNNLNGDQRCLGSRTRQVIPPGRREITLSLGQRYTTLTSWNEFLQNTATAIQILLDSGKTIGVGATTYSMEIDLPLCYVNSNHPQVGGPDILENGIELAVMRDTTLGYPMITRVWNGSAAYA